MSSSSRPRSDRRPARVSAVVVLLAVLVAQLYGPPPAAAAVPLPVVAALPGAERTSLVVDLGAGTGSAGTKAVAITIGGVPQPAELAPVISDRLAVALVVDASEAGRSALPAWLSAAARFILEAPAKTLAVAVADTSPPTVLSPPQRGPTAAVRALSAVRAGGQRNTSAALTLATQQFPPAATGPRVVVLYTTSADAGGERAATLSARLVRAGTILVVVGTAGDSTYWADAARATGGFFAPAGTPVVVPALDQVETTLRGRYLVQFATPPVLPARVSVRVDTGGLVLTGDVVVPTVPSEVSARRGSGIPFNVVWWVIAGCLIVGIAVVLILRRRSRRPREQPPEPPVEEASAPAVARGRASVPPPVARGRSPVPGSRPERPPSAIP